MFATDRCRLFRLSYKLCNQACSSLQAISPLGRSKYLKRLYIFDIVAAEISIHFYSSPPTDSPLARSNLPRSLYTFEIVALRARFLKQKTLLVVGDRVF